jgi:hypothetical protein
MVCYGSPVDLPAQMFDHPAFARFESAVAYLDDHIGRTGGDEHYTAYGFNDERGRTVDEVLRAIAAAAEEYDARHPETAADPATVPHVDYPHEPGTLYDCPACESTCHCGWGEGPVCVHCAIKAESSCPLCGDPGGCHVSGMCQVWPPQDGAQ